MHVSDYYGLSGSQGSLDFVDVHVDQDVPLFIDPSALLSLESPWAQQCVAAIQSFFQAVVEAIKGGDVLRAKFLLGFLREENATHLGFSANSRGSGVGDGLADRFYDELSSSKALASGLIKDLEDTALLVEGVNRDRISDVVTNVIRKPLAQFTRLAADYYGIPTERGIVLAHHWDAPTKSWQQEEFDLPLPNGEPLLLVPKSIVRRALHIDPGEYYRHYVLDYLRTVELNSAASSLVTIVRGQPHVYKKDVEEKYRSLHREGPPGIDKRVNTDATQRRPQLLDDFKSVKRRRGTPPLSHDELAEPTSTPLPDLDGLLAAVVALSPGTDDAHEYELAIEALLSALFYPSLVDPIREHEIHAGRKRIDISYTNAAPQRDFFHWLALNYPAASVFVECKNYSRQVNNPELDQLAGRFGASRGTYGLLVSRTIEDRAKIDESCKDTALDGRGYMTALDDADLHVLVAEAKSDGATRLGGLLHQRFTQLTG